MIRKLAIATTLSLSLALGGCGTLGNTLGGIATALTGTPYTTVSIANPITKDRLNQLEQAAVLVFTGLNAWKQSCINGVIPAACKAQIAAVQVYTRQIPPYLAQLRLFVKNNDQVNAAVLFDSITSLIRTAQSQAAANGVVINVSGS